MGNKQIAGILFLAFVVISLLVSSFIAFILNTSFLTGCFWGSLIVTVAFGLNVQHFLIIPDGNYAIILQNELSKPQLGTGSQKKDERPSNQRAVNAGFNLKWPWETIVQEPISLEKESQLGGSGPFMDEDGVNVTVKWVATLAPTIDQDLVMYHRISEADAVKLFNARINARIQGLVGNGKWTTHRTAAGLKALQKALSEEFDGDDYNDEEKSVARGVSRTVIESVSVEQSTQDVHERRANAEKTAETLRTVLAATAGDSELVRAMAVSSISGVKVPEGAFIARPDNQEQQGNKRGSK